MKISPFTRTVAAAFAILIGLYPLMYFGTDVYTHGLLHSKPAAVLNSTLWSTAFFIHIFAGGLALLTGWPQFNARRRRRSRGMHVLLGRIYVIAVALSSLSGLYVAFFATGGLVSAYGFSALALLWLFTDVMGYAAIRRGQAEPHRRWMIVNYSLTFAAVTLRLWLPLLTGLAHLEFVQAYHLVAWLCWMPNLLAAWWIARPKTERQHLQVA